MCLYITTLGVCAINYTCPAADMWLIRSGESILQLVKNLLSLVNVYLLLKIVLPPEDIRNSKKEKKAVRDILTTKFLCIFRSMPKLFEKPNQDTKKENDRLISLISVKEKCKNVRFFLYI